MTDINGQSRSLQILHAEDHFTLLRPSTEQSFLSDVLSPIADEVPLGMMRAVKPLLSGVCSHGVVTSVSPTNADILDGLRLARVRQLEMHVQPLVFSELLRREFIECECHQHPLRTHGVCSITGAYLSVSITPRGCAALDWLLSITRSPRWEQLRWDRYGN